MMNNFLKRLPYFVTLFFTLILCTNNQLLAQDKFEIFGKVTIENGTIEDTYITVYENAEQKRKVAVERSGKFSFSLDFGNDYQFVFSKEGFVTKKVSVSTFVPVEVLEQDSQFPPFKFGVSLFPTYEGLDLSIFDQPLGIIMYDKELDQFDKDPEYDAQIRDAIRKAEEEARKRAKEEEAKRLAMEKAYQKAIEKGDINFKAEKYSDARLAYNEALKIKEKAEYPLQQIQKIDELTTARKELEEKYTGLILQADVLFDEKDYENSKLRYEDALQVKPNETYPTEQIQKIDEIFAEQKRKEAEAERLALEQQEIEHKYTVAIRVADQKFEEKDYESARTAYLQALALKKGEMYPRQQVQKIDQLEKAQKAVEDQYSALISKADKEFKAEEYMMAKQTYTEALSVKANEAYPKSRISKIDEILAELKRNAEEKARLEAEEKALDDKYNVLIAKADEEFAAGNFTIARSTYQEALQLKSKETYPKERIEKIDEVLAEQKRKAEEEMKLAAQQKALDDKYNVLIAKADEEFTTKKYKLARISYDKALSLKQNEAYPKEKIQKIDEIFAEQKRKAEEEAKLLAEQKSADKKYKAILAKADRELDSENYIAARLSYTEALTLKENELYPKEKIQRIDEILNEIKRKKAEAARFAAEQKKLDDKYSALIAKADGEFSSEDYATAKSSYKEALLLKNNEIHPKDRIKKIDQLIAEQERNAQKQKILDDKYNALLVKADTDFTAEKYSTARETYEKALVLKENEAYPKEKISKIDEIFAQQKQKAEEAKRLAAEQKKLDDQYKKILAKADRSFTSGNYTLARTSYQEALNVKANESYPQERIEKIDEIVADQKQKAEAAARLAAEQKALEDQYKQLIEKADGELNAEKYEQARTTFQEALALKANEAYPKEKIKKIEGILIAQKKKAEETARLAAKQKVMDEKYSAILAKADEQFTSEEYVPARVSYNKALALKENETCPKQQIQKINDILAEKERKEKEAARIAAEQKKLEDRYQALLQKADREFTAKNYKAARANYTSALEVKADETYPQERITKIDELLEEQKQKAEAEAKVAAEQKALDEQYRSIIAKANKEFTKKSYAKAREYYQEASSLKTAETFPKERMAKIDEILAEEKRKAEEAEKFAAQQKELEEKYSTVIQDADKKFKEDDFEGAKSLYQQALEFKPGEKYPKDQLKKITVKLAEQKRLLARNEINNQKYQKLISEADQKFEKKMYRSAMYSYRDALAIKPQEKYPKEKVTEIEQILQKEEEEKQQQLALKQKAQRMSKLADKLFNQKEYQQAKAKYQESIGVHSTKYAKDQVERIDVILTNLDLVNQKKKKLDQQFEKEINKAEEHFNKEEYSIARHHFKAASNLKPKEQYPKDKLREIAKLIESLKKSEEDFVAQNPKNFETKLSIIQERKYAELIQDGDEHFKKEDFGASRVLFERALDLFDRNYPKKRIKEIDEKILAIKNSKLSKEYRDMIAKADRELSAKNYSVAKFYYKKATGLNATEKYPRNQLKEIQKILQSNKNAKVKKEYDLQIAKGDAAFNKGNLTVARFYYKKANELMPGEKYPKEKLKIIQSKQSKN